jgi:hypothetical protein
VGRAVFLAAQPEIKAPRIAAMADRAGPVFALPSRSAILPGMPGSSLDVGNELAGRDRRLLRDGHTMPSRQQQLDGIGDVLFRDVMIAPLDAE